MTQLTDIRMKGEEREEKIGEKIEKDRRRRRRGRRKSGSETKDKESDLEKEDDGLTQAGNEPKGGEKFAVSSPMPDIEANNDIPLVRIQQATPSPRPPDQSEELDEKKKSKRRKTKDEGEQQQSLEEEPESDENDEEDEEEEDVEEEEEDSEMTQEEKKAMYEAVLEGDIDVLEDCLDLPNSDINMIWFQENLLMAAIRAGHVDVAEFLLDNGVDSTFSTSVVDVQETPNGKVMERYEVDCRQMAYDHHLQDIVFLIDLLQDNLFPFIPRPVRTPRLRRSKPESSEDGDTDDDDDADDESQTGSADVSDSSSDVVKKEEAGVDAQVTGGNEQKKKKKKKKEQRKKRSRMNSAAEDGVLVDNTDGDNDDDGNGTATAADEEDGEKDKTFRTGSTFGDVDSGNYSMTSSKLKKSMLQKHDQLLEKEERSGSNSADSPRKSESESMQTKSQSQKIKEDKTDRTSTTLTQDRDQSSSGQIESETVIQNMVPELPQWAVVLNPPTNRIRSTKAAVVAKQGNLSRNFYKSPLHASSMERPLKWRKVSSTGSYARESRRWHLENKIEEANIENVKISQLSITPMFPPSSSTSNSILSSSMSLHSKSLKSQRMSTTSSDVSESISIASLSIQDRVDRFKAPKSIPKRLSPCPQNSTPEVASYMRPTQSTITKQRLGSQFVDSYGGLGFCPNPSKSTNFHMEVMKSPGKLHINGTTVMGALSRSHRVPVLTAKSVAQRRNENVISYRM